MNVVLSLLLVVVLMLIAWIGVGAANLGFLFGVIFPYVAIAAFVLGVIYRIIKWAKAPVPFKITTTCGQQKSLPWIKHSKLDNPQTGLQTFARMALEILTFRSLFRNTKVELRPGPKVVYGSNKWLWLGAMAFHWSFLIIFIRHYRFFVEPIPGCILGLQSLDGFFQMWIPTLYLTDIIILVALSYLFFRRVVIPQIRYISLPADYFPLFLILGLAISGILMRYFIKVDVVGVQELTMGLISFSPSVPEGIGLIFYIHLFFAVPTALLWIYVIVQALRKFPSPASPGEYSMRHIFWARLAAFEMTMTAITGWSFYWLAFVAEKGAGAP